MEYITTDKNLLFKDGLIIRQYSKSQYWHAEGLFSLMEFTDNQISNLLDLEIIKEVVEKEFTKGDMIEFTDYSLSKKGVSFISEDLEEWLKQRK